MYFFIHALVSSGLKTMPTTPMSIAIPPKTLGTTYAAIMALGCPPSPLDDPEFAAVAVVVVGFELETAVVGFAADCEFEFEFPDGCAGKPAAPVNFTQIWTHLFPEVKDETYL
jgi:hypothetical protein